MGPQAGKVSKKTSGVAEVHFGGLASANSPGRPRFFGSSPPPSLRFRPLWTRRRSKTPPPKGKGPFFSGFRAAVACLTLLILIVRGAGGSAADRTIAKFVHFCRPALMGQAASNGEPGTNVQARSARIRGAWQHALIRLRPARVRSPLRDPRKAEFMNPAAPSRIGRPGGILLEAEERRPAAARGHGRRRHRRLTRIASPTSAKCPRLRTDRHSGHPVSREIVPASLARADVRTGGVPTSDPNNYCEASGRLAAETPGAICANQSDNLAKPAAPTTAPPVGIWEQTGGPCEPGCRATGTGGTYAGVAFISRSVRPPWRLRASPHPHGSASTAGQRLAN